MERKQFTNLSEAIKQVWLNEDHRKGDKVIVKGKMGVVVKQVGKDGTTENDEIYKVRFEDGSVANVPARDMEMQGGTPGENESEDITQMEAAQAVIAGGIGAQVADWASQFSDYIKGRKDDGEVTPGQTLKTPSPEEKGQTKRKEPKFGGATQMLRGKQKDRKTAVRDIKRSQRMGRVRNLLKKKKK